MEMRSTAAKPRARLLRALCGAAWGVALAVTSAAHATTLLAPLDFNAPTQSMWGPGGASLDFGAKGDFGVSPLLVTYDLGASTGTVSASFDGALRVVHQDALMEPGRTRVQLGFQGDQDGGSLATRFGAWANVKLAGITVLDRAYDLNADASFRPSLGSPVTARGAFAAADVGIDILLAKAGFELEIEQNDAFSGTALTGTLAYGRRGSGSVRELPFSIANDAGIALDLALDAAGDWDFQLKDIALQTSFAIDFDVGLVAYEEHIAGVEFCRACFWGICIPYPCGIKYDRNDFELFGIDVYNGRPFPLSFDRISYAGAFTIAVSEVPEPSALLLLGGALAILARSRGRRPALRT